MASVSLATSLRCPEVPYVQYRSYSLGQNDKDLSRGLIGVGQNRCRGRRTPCHAVGDACIARAKQGSPGIDAWSYEEEAEGVLAAPIAPLWSRM